jgi:hypothetical protein
VKLSAPQLSVSFVNEAREAPILLRLGLYSTHISGEFPSGLEVSINKQLNKQTSNNQTNKHQ